jgi:putative phage-type endonuclease
MQEVNATVLAENPTEETFREVRRGIVTGTDIATILGLNPYSSLYTLALEKKGKLPPKDENDAMWIGKQLEPTILALFGRKMGRRVRPNRTIYISKEFPWAGGTPDGFTEDPLEGVEAKAVGVRSAHQWGESGGDEVPVHYWIQAQWYAGVCGGLPWNLVALIGTQGQVHPIPFDAEVFGRMIEAGRDFREKYMLTDDLPEPGADDIEAVAKVFPRSQEAELMATPEIQALAEALAKARIAKAEAEAGEKEIRARLMAAMGEKSRIKGSDFSLSWKNNKDSIRTDFEKALEKAYARLPQKYADELGKIVSEFTRPIPGPRVFRVSGALFKGGE